ncbi:uncharacterized protein LOC142784649 [Rhipicephalus microplus]|uniref:uncharacterized protein LOC142784649 n=1 Tax=Rhipicephalus microplus TaxID=6941 RepID=UPI003F6B8C6A
MPNMASRQQRIAGSRRRFTEAATSSTVEATLCSPVTAQATQHQDMGGPFQPCELAVSRAITSLPYAYSTQVCCMGTRAQPCHALRGPYSGRGGGPILTETPTSFQEPETSGSNQPPRSGRAVDRHHPRLMVQQQQPVQRQQHTVGQQQQPSWGGSSGSQIGLALDMIHQSIALVQQPHSSMTTILAAPEGTQQF